MLVLLLLFMLWVLYMVLRLDLFETLRPLRLQTKSHLRHDPFGFGSLKKQLIPFDVDIVVRLLRVVPSYAKLDLAIASHCFVSDPVR